MRIKLAGVCELYVYFIIAWLAISALNDDTVSLSHAQTKEPSQQSTSIMASNSLYICLNKEHRVSRSFRASWFLKMLSQDINPNQIVQVGSEGAI